MLRGALSVEMVMARTSMCGSLLVIAEVSKGANSTSWWMRMARPDEVSFPAGKPLGHCF